MRLFSFGKRKTKKTSFNQNIRKLTIAVPIFATVLSLPLLFLFNSVTYHNETKDLTDKVISESQQDISNHVQSMYNQIKSQQTLLDSVIKIALQHEIDEVILLKDLIDSEQESSITLLQIIKKKNLSQGNFHIALFDTLGNLHTKEITSDCCSTIFNHLGQDIILKNRDRSNQLLSGPTSSKFQVQKFILREIENSPFIILAAMASKDKHTISGEIFHNNILLPLFGPSKENSFLLDAEGNYILGSDSTLSYKNIFKDISLSDIKDSPTGLHSTHFDSITKQPNAVTFTMHLKEFDWYIGSTIDIRNFENDIKKSRKKMLWHFLNQFLLMSSVLLFMLLLSMWYGKRLSSKITFQFTSFMKSFYGLVKNKREIHTSNFAYEEFQNIITMVNTLTHDLQGSEKRFRDMAELLPVMLFECDKKGMLTYINPTTHEIFQYKAEEVLNKFTFDFFTPNDKERLIDIIEKRMAGTIDNKPRYYTAIKKDGTKFNVMIHANNIINNGKVEGIRGIITDVSEQIENEKRLKEMFEESESLNRLMIKREKRVFEMKLEVNNLLKELNRPVRYMATENIFRDDHENDE